MGMEQIIDVRKGLDLRGDPMNGERYYSLSASFGSK